MSRPMVSQRTSVEIARGESAKMQGRFTSAISSIVAEFAASPTTKAATDTTASVQAAPIGRLDESPEVLYSLWRLLVLNERPAREWWEWR